MKEWKGELGVMEVWNGAEVHEVFRRADQNWKHNSNGIRGECVTEKRNGEDKEYKNGHYM